MVRVRGRQGNNSTLLYLRWRADEDEAAGDIHRRGQSRGCGHHQGDALGPEDRSNVTMAEDGLEAMDLPKKKGNVIWT